MAKVIYKVPTLILDFLVRLLALLCLLQLFGMLNYSIMHYIIIDNIFQGVSYSTIELEQFQRVGSILKQIGFIVYLGFAITFLAWFFLAYKKLSIINPSMKVPVYWSVLLWFVPLMNLIFPLALVKRLFLGLQTFHHIKYDGHYTRFSTRIINLWWLCVLLFVSLEFLTILFYRNLISINVSNIVIFKYLTGFIGMFLWYTILGNFIGLSKKIYNNESMLFNGKSGIFKNPF